MPGPDISLFVIRKPLPVPSLHLLYECKVYHVLISFGLFEDTQLLGELNSEDGMERIARFLAECLTQEEFLSCFAVEYSSAVVLPNKVEVMQVFSSFLERTGVGLKEQSLQHVEQSHLKKGWVLLDRPGGCPLTFLGTCYDLGGKL